MITFIEDPLAYDRLVRRFQSVREREEEGKKKGYAGVLEAGLRRQEARVAAHAVDVDDGEEARDRFAHEEQVEIVGEEAEEGDVPASKEEGMKRWRWEIEERFVQGGDVEFDYEAVDGGEEFDNWRVEDREQEERWFDEEEARWADGGEEEASIDSKERGKAGLKGQTGIQDF